MHRLTQVAALPVLVVVGCGGNDSQGSGAGSGGTRESTVSTGGVSFGGSRTTSNSNSRVTTGGSSATRTSGGQTGGGLATGGGAMTTGGGSSKAQLVKLCNQTVCDSLDHLCPTQHSDCATTCEETVNMFRCTDALSDYLTCLGKVTSALCLSDGTVQQEGLCPDELAALLVPCDD